jgi:hypothetical protein
MYLNTGMGNYPVFVNYPVSQSPQLKVSHKPVTKLLVAPHSHHLLREDHTRDKLSANSVIPSSILRPNAYFRSPISDPGFHKARAMASVAGKFVQKGDWMEAD